MVGVKRGREGGEEGEGEAGREGSARPPLIVVEDWPELVAFSPHSSQRRRSIILLTTIVWFLASPFGIN